MSFKSTPIKFFQEIIGGPRFVDCMSKNRMLWLLLMYCNRYSKTNIKPQMIDGRCADLICYYHSTLSHVGRFDTDEHLWLSSRLLARLCT
jgi:hypothetical protein